jgi:trigger factor
VQAKVEKTGVNQVKLEVTVSIEEFDKAIQGAYFKMKNQINVPGFRKGKVPRKIVEQTYGEAVFYEEAVNTIYMETYPLAVEETKIEPVDRPEIDIVQIGDGKEMIYSAEVTVKPEVELGEYKGIKVEAPEYTVSNEEVEARIQQTKEQAARWVEVEGRAVQNGDRTTMDYSGSVDGVKFDGGTAEGHTLEIGSGSFIPGFEEQMIGMEKDETKDITVKFPEEYHSEELAGKEAIFTVTVHDIKSKELPELDDEFVKDVSEFDTYQEYYADIKGKMEEDAKNRQRSERENNCVKVVSDNATVEIPDAMIESQIDSTIREIETQYRQYGMNIEQYLSMTNSTMADLRAQYKESAYNRVKAQLVLEAIAKKEAVEVSEEDLNEEYARMAEQYKKEVSEIKEMYKSGEEYIKDELELQKTVALLMDAAELIAPIETIDESVTDAE